MDLKRIIAEQQVEINDLRLVINELLLENADLKSKLKKATSQNSSLPPSKDENRPKRNQSLRKKTIKNVADKKGIMAQR